MPHTHAHDQPHVREHVDANGGRGRKLLFAFALTTLMMVAEVIGGAWSGSLALIADAGHMMVDALALLLRLSAHGWRPGQPMRDAVTAMAGWKC